MGEVGTTSPRGSPDAAGDHLFSVDLEEYFHAHALSQVIGRGEWDHLPPRTGLIVPRLLDLLDASGSRATFFVLGWVAERSPDLIREVARRGHEVASHGWSHRRLTELRPEAFREEAARSKRLLEDLTGEEVAGFRAPSFSVVEETRWALEILVEEGYRYDSSIFPVRRPGYGIPGAPRDPHLVDTPAGRLLELPLATRSLAGFPLPAAGGAYLRHLPYGLVRGGLEEAAGRGAPGMFYIHSWELDEAMPRLPVGTIAELRHYGGVGRVEDRIRRLTGEFSFTCVRDMFGLGDGASRPGGEGPEARRRARQA